MNVRHDMVTVFVARPDAYAQSHEFLQLHRVAGDFLGDTWQIIRGGVEADESYPKAALREMREECGMSPAEFYRTGSIESFYTDHDDTIWNSAVFCAIVGREAEVKLNEEHDAFRWIARDQMDDHMMWASERQLLPGLLRDLFNAGPAKTYLRIAQEAVDGRQ
jgi:dihydroneopterin triphosphate diphosphatase